MKFSRVFNLLLAPLSALVFLAIAAGLGTQGLLPDPLAIHWGPTGQADGFMGLNAYLFLTGIGFLALWSALVALELTPVKAKLLRPLLKGFTGYLYVFLLVIISVTTLLQLGTETAESSFAGALLYVLLVPIAMLIWLFLAKPTVEVNQNLVIKLRGIALVSVPTQQVMAMEVATLRGRDYGGWGVRYGFNTLAFIPSSGDGVLFTLDWGEKIAVRMDRPEEFLANLKINS